jgi:hypothetical protein
MESIVELTYNETLEVNGGEIDWHNVGYSIGEAAANTVDWIQGFAEGIIKAFE